MQVLGGVINGHLGVAARIAALRRSSPEVSPQVPTLIAAEFPIIAVEATLAALTSFTLIGPLGLPWWLPIIAIVVIAAPSAGLRHLALRKGRELWSGLAVLRSLRGGSARGRLRPGRRVRADLPQLDAAARGRRRRLVLRRDRRADRARHAQPAARSARASAPRAAVLILGSDGVAAAAAAGVLLTVTGTVGGLCFAAWAGADRLWVRSRSART